MDAVGSRLDLRIGRDGGAAGTGAGVERRVHMNQPALGSPTTSTMIAGSRMDNLPCSRSLSENDLVASICGITLDGRVA
jgi:hypothetical protein